MAANPRVPRRPARRSTPSGPLTQTTSAAPPPDVPPSTPSTTARRKADRRRAIVETAALLFAQHGYADCDMECVAAALRIAKGTLYLYFRGKQELFFACVDWGIGQMQRLVVQAADEQRPPLERIARAIGAYLQFFDQHPQYVELMIQERAIFRDRKKGTYFERRDEIRNHFRKIYAQLQHDGVLRDDLSVEQMLDTIGALVYGTMFFNYAAGRSATIEVQHRSVMKAIFGGLLTEAGRRQLDYFNRRG